MVKNLVVKRYDTGLSQIWNLITAKSHLLLGFNWRNVSDPCELMLLNIKQSLFGYEDKIIYTSAYTSAGVNDYIQD